KLYSSSKILSSLCKARRIRTFLLPCQSKYLNMKCQGLRTLLSLEFKQSPNLVSLPMGLQYVSSLQNLKIWWCPSLIAIPEWISKLISLQSLEIWDCRNLESLPKGIGARNNVLIAWT
ncbi:disease resistance protein adr1, partial [Quercus suber]